MIGGLPLSMLGPKCGACGFHHELGGTCVRLVTPEEMAKLRASRDRGEFPDKGVDA